MAYELLISEKPTAALKIAQALVDGRIVKHSENKVSYYEIIHNSKTILVVPAVGHLYGLKSKEKKWTYPVYDFEWQPTYKISKNADFAKKYLDLIIKLTKNANEITICTDYDLEGEVIGLNLIRFAAKRKDAKRMKFSTLTKEELREAYKNASEHLIWPQAKAGEVRHSLDWLWGINCSRALTLAIKAAGSFKIMSTGRVQGPALNLLSKKEKEIRRFISKPYWLLELETDKISAFHKKGEFWNKEEAENLIKKLIDKTPIVKEIKSKIIIQHPPHPFDLTSLQLEAYNKLKITPKQTLDIAQNLYTKGYISYPRTSSQKLPPSIGYKKVLDKLSKNQKYKNFVKILPKELKPNEGKKSDSAHPAIYPTGEIGELTEKESKLYDLLVHRFLATFGPDARRETVSVEIDVDNEIFGTSSTRTIEPGWHRLYGNYAKFEEQELPKLEKNEKLKNKRIINHSKETQPPKRYTEASIIKELEKKSLGTKTTRAQIIDSLYQRHYIQEKSIEVTDLGLKTNETLKKYVSEILDEELTRKFEIEMDEVREEKKQPEEVLRDAKEFLTKFSKHFKENEEKIGKELLEAYRETQAQASLIGKCPNCKDGLLNIKKGKYGLFISCDHYEDCKTTFSIPKGILIRATKKICLHCKFPLVTLIRKGKRPQEICINKNCPSKENHIKLEKNKKCPKCGSELIIKKGIYGAFLACSYYPNCKYVDTSFNRKKVMKSSTK